MIGNNEILNYLLIKEDFLPEPTDIGDGKITIGSGLTDSKWLDLYRKRGNKWSKEDNRKAVLEEIQKRRLWAEQNVPHWNSLPEFSQDALLSYRYNYNFTPKNSPKLFKALEDKNYSEAAKQMDATSKNPDFKNGLLKRRKEEQQWFLSGFPELSKPNNFAIPYKYPVPEYPTVAEAYRKSMAPITDNYSQGGQLQNHKQWKDLSYSEKNDIIKVAVRNGITTLPEIRQKYNEFADGGNLYAGGGYVYDMLPQLFASDGVQVRVTSGYRPNSRVQGSGKPSRHSMHEAADIIGDFSAIRRVLDNPESNTAKWMRANGYGYLDETSKTGTKKFWHDQNGDHSHYHIGKDSGIAKKFAASTGSTSNTAPIVSTGNYLDIAKAHIRNNEGWSPMPVADGPKNTGWRSVGYGFNDSGFRAKYPQGISKTYENGITKAQAEQELDYILGNMDSHLKRVYGSKWNSFNDNQKAAILDTYYQRPASVVGRNSAFYNAVMRGDNNAVNYLGVAGYNTRNNDRRKLFSSTVTQMPEAAQAVQQPLFYQPWNPQAASLYTPYSPLTPYPAPIFSPEEQEEYFAKQIAQAQKQQEAEQMEKQRQEKADRINKFSLLMSLTDPYSSDNSSSSSTPFADAVNMLTQRSPIPYFSNGGSIFIKPENRGKFTRLKERTGHSASWFKENGTPAQKKMATFALNSRHWKHGLGGNLFDGGGDTKADIPVTFFTQSEAMPLLADNPNRTAVLDEVTVKPYKKLPMQSELFQGITNQAANEKADEFANRTSLTPERFLGLIGANVPLAAGALGATVAAPALFDSTVVPLYDYITGSSIAGVPATTWLNTGMGAGFAGHGLNHAVNEGVDGWEDAAMTALEITPLGGVTAPIYSKASRWIATSQNPNMQYVRYGLGKAKGFLEGDVPQLPQLYRKVKGIPTIEDGKMVLSTPVNRFAFENGMGQESPLITNFTTDVGVRRHADGNWNWAPTLSFPGETLLGKRVVSTRPSDTFTYGDKINVPLNKVTAVTGRGKEINDFENMGIKTLSSTDAQSAFAEDLASYISKAQKVRTNNAKILRAKAEGKPTFKRKWPDKGFDNYASKIQQLTRENFRNPTVKDYEFMDYVFNPQYNSEVVPKLNLEEAVIKYPSLVGSWYGDSGRRRYIANPNEWVNVIYDPYSPAEALFRKSKGIDLKPEWQNK